jgi:DNA-binding NtrC family response regulator
MEPAMPQRNVLVVEDDLLIRLVLVDALQDEGYAVVQAANVLEAVAAIGRHQTFDAMVTDVDMPGHLTGLDLAEMVSSVSPLTQIVVVSGRNVSEGVRPEWSFMPKPYNLDKVLRALEKPESVSTAVPIMAQAI